MKISEFVKNHIGTLEHFIEQGGWPIRTNSQEATSLNVFLPQAFIVKDGLLHCDIKKIPSKVMAAFWKQKYEEARSDSNKLYNAIDEAYRKATS